MERNQSCSTYGPPSQSFLSPTPSTDVDGPRSNIRQFSPNNTSTPFHGGSPREKYFSPRGGGRHQRPYFTPRNRDYTPQYQPKFRGGGKRVHDDEAVHISRYIKMSMLDDPWKHLKRTHVKSSHADDSSCVDSTSDLDTTVGTDSRDFTPDVSTESEAQPPVVDLSEKSEESETSVDAVDKLEPNFENEVYDLSTSSTRC